MIDDNTVFVAEAWDRRRWVIWFLVGLSALIMSVAMTFTLITSIQRADRIERIDQENHEAIECRAAYAAVITRAEQNADNAEHALFAATIRSVFTEADPAEASAILLDQAERIDALNVQTSEAIQALEDYIAAGSPLPCPLNL